MTLFPANPQVVNKVAVTHLDDDYMITVSNFERIANWNVIYRACEDRGWRVSTYSSSCYPRGLARVEGVQTIGSMNEDMLKQLAEALASLKVAIEAEMTVSPEVTMLKKD